MPSDHGQRPAEAEPVYRRPTVDLSHYDNRWYSPGAGYWRRTLWFFVNHLILRSRLLRSSRLRVLLLRLFGARIGQGVVIRPEVSVKFPWNLRIGDHSWLAEGVSIRCVAPVSIGNHCAISQAAFLCTGNHDRTSPTFRLMVSPIVLEDGVWIGTRAIVAPGVTLGSHAMLTAASVLTRDAEPYGIYQGNPAAPVRVREIRPADSP